MTPPAAASQPRDVVEQLLKLGFTLTFWTPTKANPDVKGPTEKDWPRKKAALVDWKDGMRCGIILGAPIADGRYPHDVDIDWAPGANIALAFLPKTEFVYGRASKRVSHCVYCLPEALPTFQYKDPIDGTVLLEIRGVKEDGSLGFQSMCPPSTWTKEGKSEKLELRAFAMPAFMGDSKAWQQRITLGGIGMLLAKRLGVNGFGHEARLAWAGFLLRAGIPPEDLILMGEAISIPCNNRELADVRLVVETTVQNLAGGSKKVKGGPALAKLLGGDAGKKVIDQINSWLGKDSDFVRTPDGLIVKDNQANVRRALQLIGLELSYNDFAERTLVTEQDKQVRPLDDRTMNNAWLRVDRECRFRPSFNFFEKVLSDAAYEQCFHPVRDYLQGLKWDNQPRIDTWLAVYGGADADEDSAEYLAAISSIVLIAAVRRAMHPGCKYDEMLVLESGQGMNKSTALKALCPDEGWFSDDLPLNVDAKEIIERTLGKWIIEAAELSGQKKSDRDHLKSMLSRQVDGPARMAYARIPVERPRQFIIIGTTNADEYLPDSTGNRRFWPEKVGRFNVDGIVADRDQLWAEAVYREARGESIRLPERLWPAAGERQEQRRSIDAWEGPLGAFVDKQDVGGDGHRRVTTDDLWAALNIPLERRDRTASMRISEVMQRLGYKRTTIRTDAGVARGYASNAPVERKILEFPDKAKAEF